jgi:hypothetical protein
VTAFVTRGDVVDLKYSGGEVQVVGALAKVAGIVSLPEGLSIAAGGDSQGGRGGSHGDYKLDSTGDGDWNLSKKAWVKAEGNGGFAVNLMQSGDTVQFAAATTVTFAGGIKSSVDAGVYTVASDKLVRGGAISSAWARDWSGAGDVVTGSFQYMAGKGALILGAMGEAETRFKNMAFEGSQKISGMGNAAVMDENDIAAKAFGITATAALVFTGGTSALFSGGTGLVRAAAWSVINTPIRAMALEAGIRDVGSAYEGYGLNASGEVEKLGGWDRTIKGATGVLFVALGAYGSGRTAPEAGAVKSQSFARAIGEFSPARVLSDAASSIGEASKSFAGWVGRASTYAPLGIGGLTFVSKAWGDFNVSGEVDWSSAAAWGIGAALLTRGGMALSSSGAAFVSGVRSFVQAGGLYPVVNGVAGGAAVWVATDGQPLEKRIQATAFSAVMFAAVGIGMTGAAGRAVIVDSFPGLRAVSKGIVEARATDGALGVTRILVQTFIAQPLAAGFRFGRLNALGMGDFMTLLPSYAKDQVTGAWGLHYEPHLLNLNERIESALSGMMMGAIFGVIGTVTPATTAGQSGLGFFAVNGGFQNMMKALPVVGENLSTAYSIAVFSAIGSLINLGAESVVRPVFGDGMADVVENEGVNMALSVFLTPTAGNRNAGRVAAAESRVFKDAEFRAEVLEGRAHSAEEKIGKEGMGQLKQTALRAETLEAKKAVRASDTQTLYDAVHKLDGVELDGRTRLGSMQGLEGLSETSSPLGAIHASAPVRETIMGELYDRLSRANGSQEAGWMAEKKPGNWVQRDRNVSFFDPSRPALVQKPQGVQMTEALQRYDQGVLESKATEVNLTGRKAQAIIGNSSSHTRVQIKAAQVLLVKIESLRMAVETAGAEYRDAAEKAQKEPTSMNKAAADLKHAEHQVLQGRLDVLESGMKPGFLLGFIEGVADRRKTALQRYQLESEQSGIIDEIRSATSGETLAAAVGKAQGPVPVGEISIVGKLEGSRLEALKEYAERYVNEAFAIRRAQNERPMTQASFDRMTKEMVVRHEMLSELARDEKSTGLTPAQVTGIRNKLGGNLWQVKAMELKGISTADSSSLVAYGEFIKAKIGAALGKSVDKIDSEVKAEFQSVLNKLARAKQDSPELPHPVYDFSVQAFLQERGIRPESGALFDTCGKWSSVLERLQFKSILSRPIFGVLIACSWGTISKWKPVPEKRKSRSLTKF